MNAEKRGIGILVGDGNLPFETRRQGRPRSEDNIKRSCISEGVGILKEEKLRKEKCKGAEAVAGPP